LHQIGDVHVRRQNNVIKPGIAATSLPGRTSAPTGSARAAPIMALLLLLVMDLTAPGLAANCFYHVKLDDEFACLSTKRLSNI